MSSFELTNQNRVRRLPERGRYEHDDVYELLDASFICHVGFVQDEQPFVIPTLHVRDDDTLLLHGASSSRLIRHIATGNPVSIAVTLVDGIVLARSVFNHSINYRSAVVFGRGVLLEDPDEKLRALELFTERLLPGRWADARQPSPQELKATGIVRVTLESASAKVRLGPPKDDAEDLDLPIWAGVLPVQQVVGAPLADPKLREGIAVPEYVRAFVKAKS